MAHKNNDILYESELGVSKRPKVKQPIQPVGLPVTGAWGLVMLTVCISIVYANYRVFFGVQELIPRLMLVPSSLAVIFFFVYKSAK